MIYLSGKVNGVPLGARPDFGAMYNYMDPRPAVPGPYAIDNGCFLNPDRFVLNDYLRYLSDFRCEYGVDALFVTAPDVVGNGAETLRLFHGSGWQIRELGFRVALVGQDGMESLSIPWDDMDCLFVGGSDAWKLSEHAYRLAREADERGKWVHMGRVNSWRRLKAAAVSGYDSADGTYIAFGPDRNTARVFAWLDTINREPHMQVAS